MPLRTMVWAPFETNPWDKGPREADMRWDAGPTSIRHKHSHGQLVPERNVRTWLV